jgi:hypothetical protein
MQCGGRVTSIIDRDTRDGWTEISFSGGLAALREAYKDEGNIQIADEDGFIIALWTPNGETYVGPFDSEAHAVEWHNAVWPETGDHRQPWRVAPVQRPH